MEQSQDKSLNKSCADLTADFENDYVKFSDIIKLQNQLMKSSKFIKKEDPMKYYERTGHDCNIDFDLLTLWTLIKLRFKTSLRISL